MLYNEFLQNVHLVPKSTIVIFAYTKKLVDLGFYDDNARKETIENPMETAT